MIKAVDCIIFTVFIHKKSAKLYIALSSLITISVTISLGLLFDLERANATDVSGTISTDTTWTLANSPYIITGDITVNNAATLTIEAGVEVRSSGYRRFYVRDGSTLDVNGTSGNEVVFTHDTSTSAGQWAGIQLIGSTTTATIDYAEFYYSVVGLRIESATAVVNDCLFENNYEGIDAYEQGNITTARNTFNYNQVTPIGLNTDVGTVSLGSGADVDILGTGSDANNYNAIGIAYSDNNSSDCPSNLCKISQRTFAGITNIPYLIYQDYAIGGSDDELEIDAGVIIKNRVNVDLFLRNGANLDINGTSGNEVIVTSEYDDTYGGDTNNDSTATTPGPGNWSRIGFEAGSSHTIDYAKFYYGNTALRSYGTSVKTTVQDCLFENNYVGIAVEERSELTTARNTFQINHYTPVVLNFDVGTVTFGSGADADILGSSPDHNHYNAIGVAYSDNNSSDCPSNLCKVSQRTFAGITNIPYIINQDYSMGGNDDELEIDAGVIIKNRDNVDIYIKNGADLDINGTSGNEVVFTSEYDDDHGGDTNNDGTSTTPSPGKWNRIALENDNSHTIDYAKFLYGITPVRAYSTGTLVQIQDSLFESNQVGISIEERAGLITARNTFNKNDYYPVNLNVDVGSITFGSGADADVLGTGADLNGYNGIGMAFADTNSNDCLSDLCVVSQRTFAGISNIPYIVHRDYEIAAGSNDTLQFNQGVIIKSRMGGSVDMYVKNGATLDVNGTSGNEVIFTTDEDDTYGGDTNNDGTATSPSVAEWQRIHIQAGASHTVDYAKFYYGVSPIRCYGTDAYVVIQDSLFESNDAAVVIEERAGLTTARNTFYKNNYYPISLNTDVGTISLGAGADVDILGTGSDVNGYNAIGIAYSDTSSDNCPSDVCHITQRTFAGISNIPYVVHRDYEVRGGGDTLQIDAGVILKNRPNTNFYVRNGASLDINGTSGNYVYFTSDTNDYIGGDTNNDGTATAPSRSGWYDLELESSGTFDIDYLDCSYAERCVFVDGATNVNISDSNFRESTYGIFSTPTSVPILSQLNFINNYSYGLYNNVSTPISAENFWWGADDGPLDTDDGGQCTINAGMGDTVSDDASHQVDYCPYATSMYRAPSVTTDTTTDINESSALGNGTIDDLGFYSAVQHGHIWDIYANPVIAPLPVSQWKLNDDADNSDVIDSISTNDGTFHGTGGTDDYTSAHTTTGKVNSALSFDGTNDYISLPISNPGYPLTITVWVKPVSATPVGIFDSAPGQMYVIRNYPAGYVEWWNASPRVELNLTAGVWQHLAFIFYYEGNRKIDYYKNGVYQTTETGDTNTSFAWTSFVLGNINNGSAGRYEGDLDDFRIYDEELSAAAISRIYNSGSGTEEYDFYLAKTENGVKTTPGAFTSDLTGLNEVTTYFTRAYFISNDGSIYYGDDDIFSTTAANTLPVASDVSINSGDSSIDLTEGTTTPVICTALVTDQDGFGNIISVEGKLFRTSIGHGSSDDNNNHYTVAGDTECVPSGGSGTTETYTCTFDVYFHADPTDSGSVYESDDWTCRVTPSDSVGAGSSASDTIEMDSLLAFSTVASLGYGSLDLGTDTGSTNQTTTITNTGNSPIDIELSGDDMCPDYPSCAGHMVTVDKQEYATSSFTYGSGTDLSSTPTLVDTNIAKPTTYPSDASGDILWGISIPGTVIGGLYTGLNTFTATAAN